MGTKNDPGPYDCYAAAEPDEPFFILLARDPQGPMVVRAWARSRHLERVRVASLEYGWDAAAAMGMDDKELEALACADVMEHWRREHPL